MTGAEAVARSDQVRIGQPLVIRAGGYEILLVRSEAGLFAIENRCPHLDQPLDTGTVAGRVLTCYHHGVQVDLTSGQVVFDMGHLNLEPVRAFEPLERDGRIFLHLQAS